MLAAYCRVEPFFCQCGSQAGTHYFGTKGRLDISRRSCEHGQYSMAQLPWLCDGKRSNLWKIRTNRFQQQLTVHPGHGVVVEDGLMVSLAQHSQRLTRIEARSCRESIFIEPGGAIFRG